MADPMTAFLGAGHGMGLSGPSYRYGSALARLGAPAQARVAAAARRFCVGSAAGVRFTLGQEYLGYATAWPRKIKTIPATVTLRAAAIAALLKQLGYTTTCRCVAMNDVAVVPDGMMAPSTTAMYGESVTFGQLFAYLAGRVAATHGMGLEEAKTAIINQLLAKHYSKAVKCSKKRSKKSKSKSRKRCRSRKSGRRVKCCKKSQYRSKKSGRCRKRKSSKR